MYRCNLRKNALNTQKDVPLHPTTDLTPSSHRGSDLENRIIRLHKVHHRKGHEDPEWERTYSSSPSLTSALDVGGRSTPRPSRFTSGKEPVPIVPKAGWASQPVWTGAENLPRTGV
jgi:hypothetical protein